MNLPPEEEPADTPPLFGTWRRWYAIVLIELAIIIVLAYVLTEAYR